MRIIGGRYRGRHLTAVVGPKTRPTADRTRETIFNILLHRCLFRDGQISGQISGGGALEGLRVLDVFAGTGALGLEALSRGASPLFFVEKDRKMLAALRQNADFLDEASQITFYGCNATSLPFAKKPCNLVFLDPPYHKNLVGPALAHLRKQAWIAPRTWIVVEVCAKEVLSLPSIYHLEIDRRCGASHVYFFRMI